MPTPTSNAACKKGYVKIQQVPSRRYAYFLTPQGFAEKARLTGEYLTSSLQFFRRAREQMDEIIALCAAHGTCAALPCRVPPKLPRSPRSPPMITTWSIIGVIDAGYRKERFCGLPVVARLADLGSVDAVIVTGTENADDVARVLADRLGPERVYVPDLVQIAHIRKAKKGRRDSARSSNGHEAELSRE